jgi:hypothetical protein
MEHVMSIDPKVRNRILRAVADVRKAAAVHNARCRSESFPSQAKDEHEPAGKLHLMLPKPHTSIW